MMLGQMRLARGMYRDGEPVLAPDDRELGEALAQAVARLPQNIYELQTQSADEKTFDPAIPAPDYIKPNAIASMRMDGSAFTKTAFSGTG